MRTSVECYAVRVIRTYGTSAKFLFVLCFFFFFFCFVEHKATTKYILKMGTESVTETPENLHILTRLSASENLIEQHSSAHAAVHTAVLVTVQFLWEVTPDAQRLGATCCLYLQGGMKNACKFLPTSYPLISYFTFILFRCLKVLSCVLCLAPNDTICIHTSWSGVTSQKNWILNVAIVQNIYEGWNFNSGNYLFTTDTK